MFLPDTERNQDFLLLPLDMIVCVCGEGRARKRGDSEVETGKQMKSCEKTGPFGLNV